MNVSDPNERDHISAVALRSSPPPEHDAQRGRLSWAQSRPFHAGVLYACIASYFVAHAKRITFMEASACTWIRARLHHLRRGMDANLIRAAGHAAVTEAGI